LSGKCDVFYADYDLDGYPSRSHSARFCTVAGVSQSGPYTTRYVPPRVDGKWDCCDYLFAAHPGATEFATWRLLIAADTECENSRGDANCDGTVEVDPTAIITTGCQVMANSQCEQLTRVPTATDCGSSSLCGCGAPGSGGECSIYCSPGDPGVVCR
jgi:hypothetical protein